jgi:hypothetical protein
MPGDACEPCQKYFYVEFIQRDPTSHQVLAERQSNERLSAIRTIDDEVVTTP